MNASVSLIEQVLPSTVGLQVTVPQDHHSAPLLGTERMGSGAVIDPAGYILTVNYIVIGASTIRVNMVDNTQLDAEVVARDFASGIAVLKITQSGFPALPLASSTSATPGDDVFLVAVASEDNNRRINGGGLSSVSAFDAHWEYSLDRALLTTAMNPGFGGGPMIDLKGRMIGVVSLNLNEVGKFSLAIPVENFSDHRDELLRYGRRISRPSRAWIGMYSYSMRDHIVVAGVLPSGPGDAAGLQAGDVVLAIDEHEISDRHVLYKRLWSRQAGDTVLFRVFRNNAVRTIPVISGNVEEFFA